MKKKIFLFITFVIFSLCPLFTFEKKLSFSFSPKIGPVFGKLGEYIYSEENEDYILSYMEWALNPIWQVGLNSAVKYKKFECEVDFNYGLPFQCGNMYDSDWNEYSGIKTVYSISEESNVLNLETALQIKYDFNLSDNFCLSPVLREFYSYIQFEARNARGWYGSSSWSSTGKEVSWDDPAAHYFPDGKYKLGGVDYFRHTAYTFFGLEADFNFLEKWQFTFAFLISPFTYTFSVDHHLSKTGGIKEQQIQFGYFNRFNLTGKISFKISKNISVFLDYSFLAGPETKGELLSASGNQSFYLSDQLSGSDVMLHSINSGVTIRI